LFALGILAQASVFAAGSGTLVLKTDSGDHNFAIEIATTDQERALGLMFRRSLPENAGMLFLYDRPQPATMWMKNTLIGLSVAFIDKRGRIINIEDMEPQTEEAHAARAPAAFALEVNQGWFKKRGIKAGDRIEGLEKIPKSKD